MRMRIPVVFQPMCTFHELQSMLYLMCSDWYDVYSNYTLIVGVNVHVYMCIECMMTGIVCDCV